MLARLERAVRAVLSSHSDLQETRRAVEDTGTEIKRDAKDSIRHRHCEFLEGSTLLKTGANCGGVEQLELHIIEAGGQVAGFSELALVTDRWALRKGEAGIERQQRH